MKEYLRQKEEQGEGNCWAKRVARGLKRIDQWAITTREFFGSYRIIKTLTGQLNYEKKKNGRT